MCGGKFTELLQAETVTAVCVEAEWSSTSIRFPTAKRSMPV